jgi:tetratricopeptide (TPR) repeat protein
MVTESEIQKAESLSAQRDFATALDLHQEMLPRAQDAGTRMRLLFGMVICSSMLDLRDVTEDARRALEQLPDSKAALMFADFLQAQAFTESGKAEEALILIDTNLLSGSLENEDQDWKYEHLFYKGKSLVQLARYEEALDAFDAANAISPNGQYLNNELIERSNCLIALNRFDEAFDAAHRAATGSDKELAILALQHMAECRLWQKRASEALTLYLELQKKLPCANVDEERVQRGISNAMAFLEKQSCQRKPF